MTSDGAWPSLRVADWEDTRDTLHMWTQVIGKLRLAAAPMVNHWWQVPLYVSPRGLTTSSVPWGRRVFDVEFDFVAHVLRVRVSSGEERTVALEPKSVAQFHDETRRALTDLGLDIPILSRPVEVVRAIPFEDDHEHASYDADAVHRFWGQLVATDRVLGEFRSRFLGKVSPVHFFWGSFDVAVTRFSGRTAPAHPGGAPNCGDWVMVEGYSHELSSAGFWPGGGEEGAFYAYAYPEPDGFTTHPVRPSDAYYYAAGGQFVLPYEAVRLSADPEGTLLGFLQDTYEAAAVHGSWDRASLER